MTARKLPTISYSQIQEFLRCEYAWSLRYKEKLDSAVVNAAMEQGNAVHYILAHYLDPHESDPSPSYHAHQYYVQNVARCAASIDDYGGLIDRCQQIAENAIEYLADKFDLGPHSTVCLPDGTPLVEHKLVTNWETSCNYVGIVDWVCKDRDGRIWLIDHKVRKQFQPDDAEESNLQAMGYAYLLRDIYKLEVTGTATFQISGELPKEPTLNKNGTMSKVCKTTWEKYRTALLANGLRPEDYVDMQVKLADTQFFHLSKVFRSSGELNNAWNQILYPAIFKVVTYSAPIMAEHRAIRTMNYLNCRMCGYRDLCYGRFRDYDVDHLIGTRYTKREEKVDVESSN